jgi:hypothetical protein
MLPRDRVSSVEEIDPPVDSTGRYARKERCAFGPEKPVWRYNGERNPDFFSPTFSGAQRLPNGNTLTCLGLSGTVLEVTREGTVVWKYALTGGPPLPPPHPFPGAVPPGAPVPPPVLVPRNPVFRALRYAPEYPGLVGKDLAADPAP